MEIPEEDLKMFEENKQNPEIKGYIAPPKASENQPSKNIQREFGKNPKTKKKKNTKGMIPPIAQQKIIKLQCCNDEFWMDDVKEFIEKERKKGTPLFTYKAPKMVEYIPCGNCSEPMKRNDLVQIYGIKRFNEEVESLNATYCCCCLEERLKPREGSVLACGHRLCIECQIDMSEIRKVQFPFLNFEYFCKKCMNWQLLIKFRLTCNHEASINDIIKKESCPICQNKLDVIEREILGVKVLPPTSKQEKLLAELLACDTDSSDDCT